MILFNTNINQKYTLLKTPVLPEEKVFSKKEADRGCNTNLCSFYYPLSFGKGNLSYQDFFHKCRYVCKDENISDLIKKSIQNNKNFIGSGKDHRVYKLDGVNDYVVRVPLNINDDCFAEELKPITDYFPNVNVGQAVAGNNRGVSVLKKVKGYEHGIKMSKLFAQKNLPTQEDAEIFLQQLKIIAGFENASYVDLAKQFKQINKSERFFVDTNPNNLMVDVLNNKLTVIDLFDKTQVPGLENFTSHVNAMISLILDGQMHTRFLEKLSDVKKQEMINTSRIIIDKCKNAGLQAGILQSKISVADYFDNLMNFVYFKKGQKHTGITWGERYNDFCNLYKDILPKDTTSISHFSDIEKLKYLFNSTNIIEDYYLPFLYEQKKVQASDLTEIIESNPEKISREDINYFIRHHIPLTHLDNELIINNRLNCLNAKSFTKDSDEYINNNKNILKHELALVDKAPAEKKLVIVTGLPGSGKSFFIENENLSKNFYIADCDAIKEQFPAYIEDNAMFLNTLHDISRKILQQQILPYALKNNKNVVIPTTGWADYVEMLASVAKKFGYNVEVVYMKTTPEKSMKNVINRFMNGGRWVDPFFTVQRAVYLDSQMMKFKNSNLIDKFTVQELF